jgi:NADPH:quinone reductase-like Zn-dependent oxidoreductase
MQVSWNRSSSPEKGERVRQLGADHVIDYRATKDWGEQARALTGARGVDRVTAPRLIRLVDHRLTTETP